MKDKKCKCKDNMCAYGRDNLNFFNCKECKWKVEK